MWYNEIGLCARNIDTTLSSIVYTIRRTYLRKAIYIYIHIFTLTSYNFGHKFNSNSKTHDSNIRDSRFLSGTRECFLIQPLARLNVEWQVPTINATHLDPLPERYYLQPQEGNYKVTISKLENSSYMVFIFTRPRAKYFGNSGHSFFKSAC
jgi:hypothetical protein